MRDRFGPSKHLKKNTAVNHDILLHKLYIQYGIKGLPLSLLKNDLENRSHYVVINDSRSEMAIFTCGVPQGSTLGLFCSCCM